MAQEQEYKHPNVCGPQTPWSGEAGWPQTRRTFLLKGLPSVPACLGRTAAPQPQPGVLQKFLPPMQSLQDSQFSRTTLGDRVREGRKDGQGG